MRNLSAGVLLLLKEKLRQLSAPDSDEALIKQRLLPEVDAQGFLRFRGQGKKTVDVAQMKERLQSLQIAVDWKRVEAIVGIRNDIEHYCTGESTARLKELMSDTFVVVQDFIGTHLRSEPVDLLGVDAWKVLLETAEVFAKEDAACRAALDEVTWGSDEVRRIAGHIRCPECQSALVKPIDASISFESIELQCTSCGHVFAFEEEIEAAIEDCYGGEAFIAAKEGCEPPMTTCPECGRETYLYSEDSCLACGQQLEYTECSVCEEPLGPHDQAGEGLCSYHSYVAHKDD